MTRLVAIVLLVLSLAATAQAQALDCQQPRSDIDQAICRSADLMTANGAVGVAYDGLLHSLSGPAREHLVTDQARWTRNNQTLCIESVRRFSAVRIDTQIAACLIERMSARKGRLLRMPAGGEYPFISEQLLVDFGLAERSAYRLFVSYPQFDMPGVDNHVLNARIAAEARQRIDVKPLPRPGTNFAGPWLVEVRHDLRFPVRGVAAVSSSLYARLDSVPPRSTSFGRLVEIAKGRQLGLDDVFTDGWRRLVPTLCRDSIRRDSRDVPSDARLVEMLSQPNRWLFGRDGVEIVFRVNEEGATPSDARLVAISYEQLKDILRRDGPLADKAR